MNDLLELAVEAHGGLKRWSQLTTVKASLSITGTEGLLRRHQYTVDVLGNAPGLNYASDYRNVSGVVVPTKRRVFAYDSEKRKIPGAPLVAIDAGRSLRKVFENRKSLNLWGGYS
jgi:hypothetical protein